MHHVVIYEGPSLQKLIDQLCLAAIGINLCLFGVGIFYVDSSLSILSITNIALLSSRFLFMHKTGANK